MSNCKCGRRLVFSARESGTGMCGPCRRAPKFMVNTPKRARWRRLLTRKWASWTRTTPRPLGGNLSSALTYSRWQRAMRELAP